LDPAAPTSHRPVRRPAFLADALRDVADDLAALKPAPIQAADASPAYGAGEQALLNQLKATVNALAGAVLRTTKG
jgi:hypothetical protein